MMEKLKTKTQAKNRRDRSTVEALRLQTFLKNELFGPPPPPQNLEEFGSVPRYTLKEGQPHVTQMSSAPAFI